MSVDAGGILARRLFLGPTRQLYEERAEMSADWRPAPLEPPCI